MDDERARQEMISRGNLAAGRGTEDDIRFLRDHAGGVVEGPADRADPFDIGCLLQAMAVGLVGWLLVRAVVAGARGLSWVATESPVALLIPTLDTSVAGYVVSTLVLVALGPVALLLLADRLRRSQRVAPLRWLLRSMGILGVPVLVLVGINALVTGGGVA